MTTYQVSHFRLIDLAIGEVKAEESDCTAQYGRMPECNKRNIKND